MNNGFYFPIQNGRYLTTITTENNEILYRWFYDW